MGMKRASRLKFSAAAAAALCKNYFSIEEFVQRQWLTTKGIRKVDMCEFSWISLPVGAIFTEPINQSL